MTGQDPGSNKHLVSLKLDEVAPLITYHLTANSTHVLKPTVFNSFDQTASINRNMTNTNTCHCQR